ncbi:hypothetical protein ACFL5G_03680 [Candidatus Margulisiibacteriota bacterium]
MGLLNMDLIMSNLNFRQKQLAQLFREKAIPEQIANTQLSEADEGDSQENRPRGILDKNI